MAATLTRLNPDTLPDPSDLGYSQISIAGPGRLAFVSGQVALSTDGSDAPSSLDGQVAKVIENLKHALAALSAKPQDIVQMRIYMTDLDDEAMSVAMPPLTAFLQGARPSVTGIGVAALAMPGLKIEVEMVVHLPAESAG
ncbi:RidA family protein [Tateyamaria sp. ANG-S1]|uniref:RidA family protein n=1 Tax=Tateyamaria sp. ANG-S1 TaxID=1577905 RepID=UPI00057C4775|nr:RidA family protein [Tateyamaria sp. ANG-S1]KIC49303.1 endoribonuclease L-PSP [Tateyamaria sp. ANG-S1]